MWAVPWMAEGKRSRVNKCMATAHSAKLVTHGEGTPDCSVAYEVARWCGMWLSGFRSSEGHKFSIFPLLTLSGTFLSGAVEVGSCCTHTGLYLDFITTEQSCSLLTHTERGKWGKSSLKWELSQSVFKYWSLKGMTRVAVHQNHQDFLKWELKSLVYLITQLFHGDLYVHTVFKETKFGYRTCGYLDHPASAHWLAGLDQA